MTFASQNLFESFEHEANQDHKDADVLDIFGRDLAGMSPSNRQVWLDRAFQYWRRRGFPYPMLCAAEVEREFHYLRKVQPDKILRGNWVTPSTSGLRLANSFHPQMWRVPVHGRSPVQLFEDDDALRKALSKAAHFWPGRRCWNAQCIRSVMRILHRVRVSNFRPACARAIVERFSATGQQVVDPSAGYGGRLLGALTLPRHYIGIDPAREQIVGLRRMIASLHQHSLADAEVHQACAEEYLSSLPTGKTDLVFTSPPYYDLEKYSSESTQSYIRYPTYREWKQQFLEVIIAESYRLLRKGGHLVLNVSDVGRRPIATDACRIAGRFFNEEMRQIRMTMSTMPTVRANGKTPYRWEPILVWTK